MSSADAALWRDLPATLTQIDLIGDSTQPGKHSWLLNTRFGVIWLLLMAKREKGITFADLAKKLNRDIVWMTGALFGQQTMDVRTACTIVESLGFDPRDEKTGKKMVLMLQSPPMRTSCPVPDPTIVRFKELTNLYSPTFKAIIHEQLGDGVVSAVDCKVHLQILNRDGQWIDATEGVGATAGLSGVVGGLSGVVGGAAAGGPIGGPLPSIDPNVDRVNNIDRVNVDRVDPRNDRMEWRGDREWQDDEWKLRHFPNANTNGLPKEPRVRIIFDGKFVPYQPW